MTDKQWLGMTEAQRIKAKLWSKRDRESVDHKLWGYGDFTIKIEKTFGEKLIPKPSTLDDIHCHRVVNRALRSVTVARALKMKPLPPRD